MTIKQTLAKIKRANDRIEVLNKELDLQRSELEFECTICRAKHRIKDCVALQNHSYTSPRGCSDGDYWTADELWAVCPDHPAYASRFLFQSYYSVPWPSRENYAHNAESQFKRLFKKLFRENHDQYREQVKHNNNFYIDNNHDYFGINIK